MLIPLPLYLLLAETAPTPAQLPAPSIVVTDVGILTFCIILVTIFGAIFALINKVAERASLIHMEFAIWKAQTNARFDLWEARMGESARVGIYRALEVLAEPNPWTQEEMDIRNRMHHNPELKGISENEILRVVQRLDAEIDEGALHGEKLMAAQYLLRELNGELAYRQKHERSQLMAAATAPGERPRGSGLRWLFGKN